MSRRVAEWPPRVGWGMVRAPAGPPHGVRSPEVHFFRDLRGLDSTFVAEGGPEAVLNPTASALSFGSIVWWKVAGAGP
eukprot:1326854-Pyramimonas_sp.AAC.1